MVSLRPTVYRSCNDAMFADPNYSAVFLRMRWDERAKAYGRGRGERRLRTRGARVRPVRTTCSDVETASRASLWASAEGTRATNSLLRGAVPAHAFSGPRNGPIGPSEAQRVADAVIGRILGVPKPGAHSEAHARAREIRGILSEHPVQVRVSCAARGSASAMESAFA
jgi:hypothetical protein